MTPQLNRLDETVQMRGHNIRLYAALTKIILNYHQILSLIKSSDSAIRHRHFPLKYSHIVLFCYEMVFLLQKILKNLDSFYMTDLDYLDSFVMENTLSVSQIHKVPYFFDYKMEYLSFQNNHKNPDPSYKMDQVFGIVEER